MNTYYAIRYRGGTIHTVPGTCVLMLFGCRLDAAEFIARGDWERSLRPQIARVQVRELVVRRKPRKAAKKTCP